MADMEADVELRDMDDDQFDAFLDGVTLSAEVEAALVHLTGTGCLLCKSAGRTLRAALERAGRIEAGQKQTCSYVMLPTEGSVEVDMYEKLKGHSDFSERMYREVARARLKGEGR
jgi:hypothetical protein